jgi:hypothetical protein
MILTALLAALVIRLLPVAGLEHLRTPLALLFALLAGSGSLYVVWKDVRATKHGETGSGYRS